MKKINNKKSKSSQTLQLVCFKIDSEVVGIDILKVKEIIKMTTLTPLQESYDIIEGLINLRGQIIPVINLRTRFQLPRKDYDINTRIILIEKNNKTIGLIVDSVSEVLTIGAKNVEAVPEISNPNYSDYIQSIVKNDDHIIILIDIDKVLIKTIMEIINELAA